MGKIRDGIFSLSKNLLKQTNKKTSSKPIQLEIKDKHEPFGTLSIAKIKRILADEEFSELQSLYFYMLRDLEISSAEQTRREQLLSVDYTLTSDNKAFIAYAENLQLDNLITHLSSSIYFGIALIDAPLEFKNNLYIPNFNLISPRYIHAKVGEKLKSTKEHLYIKQGFDKKYISSLDFNCALFHKHPISIGTITDFILANKIVWYFSLKHLVIAHNLQYFDAVATPPLIAKSEGDVETLVDTLFTLKSAGVGGFSKDDVIEYLKAPPKADFLSFIKYIDNKISKAILGNTLSTDQSQTGSYAQSIIHQNRQHEKLAFDARLIQKTITQYLNRLEILNFSTPRGIDFKFEVKQQQDIKELTEAAKNLTDAGFELDQDDLQEKSGFKIIGKRTKQSNAISLHSSLPEVNSDNDCPCCNNINSETNNTKTLPADYLDEQNVKTKEIEKELITQVEKVLNKASNFDEALNNLLELYPTMSLDKLEKTLEQNIVNSKILAQAEVETEK